MKVDGWDDRMLRHDPGHANEHNDGQ